MLTNISLISTEQLREIVNNYRYRRLFLHHPSYIPAKTSVFKTNNYQFVDPFAEFAYDEFNEYPVDASIVFAADALNIIAGDTIYEMDYDALYVFTYEEPCSGSKCFSIFDISADVSAGSPGRFFAMNFLYGDENSDV